MNYERIILELLDRIQTLEDKVAELENRVECKNDSQDSVQVGLTDRARAYIALQKQHAKEQGLTEIVLLCNDIQKALGVTNRTPCICTAMYDSMRSGDEVLFAPPSGKSTTVKVKYFIR